jgi:glycosyltransferase involved in cell wall biosynthesis
MVRAQNLVSALRVLGHEVEIVAAAEEIGTAMGVRTYRRVLRRALPAGVALGLRTLGRLALARRQARRVVSKAREQGADLIVETQVHGVSSGARAAKAVGLPLALDDCSPPDEEFAFQPALPGRVRQAFRREGEAASAMFVSSQALAHRLGTYGMPSGKLTVVPNGVHIPQGCPQGREESRQELGLEGRVVLGFVGSFQPWHRVDLLIGAASALAPSMPIHLLLIGDGFAREAAVAEASRLEISERITFTGHVIPSRLPRMLAACDVGVLPGSNDYGQPMKLMEYAAAGIPAVAPDLPPVREVVRHGETGLLFSPGDSTALADILTGLVEDSTLRTQLGEAGRQSVLEKGWAHSARSMAAALRVVLHQEGRP